MKSASVFTDRNELQISEAVCTFSGAPTYASAVWTGTTGKVTFASLVSAAIGNTITITISGGGSAGSEVVTNTGYAVDIKAATNSTATQISSAVNNATNVNTFLSATETTSGAMGANTNTIALSGGNDKITSSLGTVSLVSKGVYDLTLSGSVINLDGVHGVVHSKTGTSVDVAKVEADTDSFVSNYPDESSTITVRMYDYAGALTDVDAAGSMHVMVVGHNR